jgi:diadenosine tetraphosphate (Ap4A) HIT family hydrolase
VLLHKAQAQLQDKLSPEGFTIGINEGQAAGQTVPHVHMHLIPRHPGDVADPRGGVRWILPDKARFWKE